MLVVILTTMILVDEIAGGFEGIRFVSTVFTAMIVADAIFLVIAIMRDSEFDKIAFESSLVIALIFVRFPLFTTNELSYGLSIVGMAFASASLYLFVRSRANEQAFAGRVQMSYELRESMTTIKGYSEMALESLDDVDAMDLKPDLERINEAGERLLPLIDDILDLSRSEPDTGGEVDPEGEA
jgi:signal transduction histidine kinase